MFKKYWSADVTKKSHPGSLEAGVFSIKDPVRIARSLKRSAEASDRKKSSSYQSAMSRLTFYLNRAGKNLPSAQQEVLEKAKDELRKLYRKA